MRYTICLILCLMFAAGAVAKNVDLSTVPDRQSVQLTIYNSEDLTLVRETRRVSFKPGINPLQFSWANTLIDPTSVELRFLEHADELVVLDTMFPHDKPQMLYWNVQSEFDGEAMVEISYFTSGITWSADYTCIADADETTLRLEGFVRVTNNSGEDYENAQIRLVVGKINLVEKIAQLARLSIKEVESLKAVDRNQLRQQAARSALAPSEGFDFYESGGKPKEIIKEGLSEYFIYTVEGTETIPNQWSKRMRSFEAKTVPFAVKYRYRPQQYGDQLVRLYVLTNDEASGLGTTPLPDGVVRVFRNNGRGGLSYLGAESIQYVPIGDKIEVNLGPDPRVIFEIVELKSWRDNIWVQLRGAEVFRRVDGGNVDIDAKASVVGWDVHALCSARIRNYTDKTIDVEFRCPFSGDVVFRSELNPVLHDFRTVEFHTTVPAGQKQDHYFELLSRKGRNEKQGNVTLETARIVVE